jgi:hypothetical protein
MEIYLVDDLSKKKKNNNKIKKSIEYNFNKKMINICIIK